jgi:N utilization substance protein B
VVVSGTDTAPGQEDTPPRRRTSTGQARHKARRLAVQALYQAQINPGMPLDLIAEFRAEHAFDDADEDYFTGAVTTVLRRTAELDLLISPLLDRALEELDPVERAILRLAAWELRDRIDVPWRVVIDQGITMARLYGAAESHRYINGVLDRLARSLRSAEVAAGRG